MEDEIKGLKEKLEIAEKEREEYLNGWKRAKADFINYKKEEQKVIDQARDWAIAGFALEVINVLDSWEMAEKQSPKDSQGFALIRQQLEGVLKKAKVEKMTVSLGQQFDPKFHESMGEAESDQPPETIGEVLLPGYLYDGVTLRPAKVKVAKPKK